MLPLWELEQLAEQRDSLVGSVWTTVHLAISPAFLLALRPGVEQQLQQSLNRHFPPLSTVLVGWKDLRLTSRTGLLLDDSPEIHIGMSNNTISCRQCTVSVIHSFALQVSFPLQ